MGRNRVIGAGNALPWHLPEDLRHFKALTLGKPVVMGRKTHDSIGRPLPGRPNLVVSRRSGYAPAGVTVYPDLQSALARAVDHARDLCTDAVMVIGGAEIYCQALPLARRIYLTEVDAAPQGDAWFPPLGSDWTEEQAGPWTQSQTGPAYRFLQLVRSGSHNPDTGAMASATTGQRPD